MEDKTWKKGEKKIKKDNGKGLWERDNKRGRSF